jgi:hypothetical protein
VSANPLRDEQGRRIPDEIERQAMRQAALQEGYTRPGVRDETPRGWMARAAGARQWVDTEAVNAELRALRDRGEPAGGDVREQLEIMHRHLDMIDLTDRNDLHAFQERMEREAAAGTMGPGSGICQWLGGDSYRGDPEMIARAREAVAIRARMAAQAQGRLDASAIRFPGPYNVCNSVA